MSITIHHTLFNGLYNKQRKAIAHDFPQKLVDLVHSKLNFATCENIFKRFQEEDKPDILMETMHLLGIGITLTRARQIVIINVDYILA